MEIYIKEKGITLVALVITVIILIIIAGVTISLINGQNSFFVKVKNGAFEYDRASEVEVNQVDGLDALLTEYLR